MTEYLARLFDAARLVRMTTEDIREQRISFAYGNLNCDGPRVTREEVERCLSQQTPPVAS